MFVDNCCVRPTKRWKEMAYARTLKTIPRDLRLAREQALLGKYDDAVRYFCRVHDGIKQARNLSESAASRRKWDQAKEDVAGELRIVKELQEKLSYLSSKPGVAPRSNVPKTPFDEREIKPTDPSLGGRPPTGVSEFAPPPATSSSPASRCRTTPSSRPRHSGCCPLSP